MCLESFYLFLNLFVKPYSIFCVVIINRTFGVCDIWLPIIHHEALHVHDVSQGGDRKKVSIHSLGIRICFLTGKQDSAEVCCQNRWFNCCLYNKDNVGICFTETSIVNWLVLLASLVANRRELTLASSGMLLHENKCWLTSTKLAFNE